MSEQRKQHHVPQTYLKNFAAGKKGDSLCRFGIHEKEYTEFAQECREKNIKFIIDDENFYFSEKSSLINIIFYKSDAVAVDKILTRMAIESENRHTYKASQQILADDPYHTGGDIVLENNLREILGDIR